MYPKAVLQVTVIQVPAHTGHSLGLLSANTQLADESPWTMNMLSLLQPLKCPWLPYSITVLWGTPRLRARDSSHCKPRGATSLSPCASPTEQAPCSPHGPSPTSLTHHPAQCTGMYLVFIHLCSKILISFHYFSIR